MHPNPIFRRTDIQLSLGFTAERGFGTLTMNGDTGPVLAHVPFLLNDDGASADLHLVKSNPIARAVQDEPVQAVIAVNGPDSYISPDWYDVPDQVPTWNYVAVHLRGTLNALPPTDLKSVLDRQTAHFETQLAPKPAWTSDKMTDGVMEWMMRAILPFRFNIDVVDSTWKLNQNKDDSARESAADYVQSFGIGHETGILSGFMRNTPSKD